MKGVFCSFPLWSPAGAELGALSCHSSPLSWCRSALSAGAFSRGMLCLRGTARLSRCQQKVLRGRVLAQRDAGAVQAERLTAASDIVQWGWERAASRSARRGAAARLTLPPEQGPCRCPSEPLPRWHWPSEVREAGKAAPLPPGSAPGPSLPRDGTTGGGARRRFLGGRGGPVARPGHGGQRAGVGARGSVGTAGAGLERGSRSGRGGAGGAVRDGRVGAGRRLAGRGLRRRRVVPRTRQQRHAEQQGAAHPAVVEREPLPALPRRHGAHRLLPRLLPRHPEPAGGPAPPHQGAHLLRHRLQGVRGAAAPPAPPDLGALPRGVPHEQLRALALARHPALQLHGHLPPGVRLSADAAVAARHRVPAGPGRAPGREGRVAAEGLRPGAVHAVPLRCALGQGPLRAGAHEVHPGRGLSARGSCGVVLLWELGTPGCPPLPPCFNGVCLSLFLAKTRVITGCMLTTSWTEKLVVFLPKAWSRLHRVSVGRPDADVRCGVGRSRDQSQAGQSLNKLGLVDRVLEAAEISALWS